MKIALLDELYREFIRKRAIRNAGGCEKCLSPRHDIEKEDGKIFPAWKQLQTAHFIPRGNYHVRWDEDNAAGLCGGCHRRIDNHSRAKEDFIAARLGGAYDLLQGRERATGKVDRNAIYLYLKEQIRILDESNDRPSG